MEWVKEREIGRKGVERKAAQWIKEQGEKNQRRKKNVNRMA